MLIDIGFTRAAARVVEHAARKRGVDISKFDDVRELLEACGLSLDRFDFIDVAPSEGATN